MAGDSIARGKGEGHKNGTSISGRGSEFKRGEAGAKGFRGGKKGEPKANRKRNPRKNKSPKPAKVVGSFKGRVERKGRHHALIDSCIYIGIEAGDEINAGLNAQKP